MLNGWPYILSNTIRLNSNCRCGGSSLTASVAVVNSGMISIVESVTKDEGGDNITNILSDYLADEFKRKYKVDPR